MRWRRHHQRFLESASWTSVTAELARFARAIHALEKHPAPTAGHKIMKEMYRHRFT